MPSLLLKRMMNGYWFLSHAFLSVEVTTLAPLSGNVIALLNLKKINKLLNPIWS